MLLKFFKRRVYVKPLNTSKDSAWGVFEMSIVESFFDDWIRYGLSVAFGNFQTEWTILHA